tara:strand:- start:3 stop:338 length:336 start_codon:yes stop_codon:yes gene_type:complete
VYGSFNNQNVYFFFSAINKKTFLYLMKKILGLAGAIALSIIPTPSFSGGVEQKEMMSVTEQLLPQIGEKYKNLDIKEKKAYKEALINYLEDVQKTEATGVGEAFRILWPLR